MLTVLDELLERQVVRDLDLHFAALLQRLHGTESPEVLLGAALVSNATGNGDVCLDLARVAGQPLGGQGGAAVTQAPALDPWLAALRASPVVGAAGEFRPLVLDARGRLYLHRYWEYEQQVSQGLRAHAARSVRALDSTRTREGLARLFPSGGTGDTDWQKIAAATALLRDLCVISGGPGTGKTTTVVRILALLIEQKGPPGPRIALAAPTGKAAARLQEAIRSAKANLPVEAAVRESIPEQASTIHRLLGALPDSAYFRHNRSNPLPVDVVVIDEASMVDLALLAKLLDAMPQEARLILLGDKDQLASVEAGAVLGDICAGATGFSVAFTRQLRELTGETIAAGEGPGAGLDDSVVLLTRTHRFGAESGIGTVAQLVNAGRVDDLLESLRAARYADVGWSTKPTVRDAQHYVASRAVAHYRAYFEGVAVGADPVQLLDMFGQFRILCAHREGPLGAAHINRVVEEALRAARLIGGRDAWYAGRPVMVTRNDYNLRLFNGDIGVVLPLPDEPGQHAVVFAAPGAGVRHVSPLRLPEHDTVYAMTTHKSQGSEFDRVLLVLPLEPSPVLSRELIYTGITRAAHSVEIVGPEEIIRYAIARRIERSSGLAERLWPPPSSPQTSQTP
jgi:exodeoxyribonuclease V alpha subunit